MNGLIIFVCSANVCRSPSMRFYTQVALEKIGTTVWEFDDAGTRAITRSAMCRKSAAAISELEGGKEFAAAHRAHQLTRGRISEADILVASSAQERSDIARLDSAARSRTFTMIELVRLSQVGVVPHALLDVSAGTLSDSLNSARPFLTSQNEFTTSRRWPESGSIDIPDVHTGQTRSHRQLKRAVPWLAERIAITLGGQPGRLPRN